MTSFQHTVDILPFIGSNWIHTKSSVSALPAHRERDSHQLRRTMTATVMAAVLLGAFLHALWNSLVYRSDDKAANTIIIVAGAGAIGGCCLPFLPLPNESCWPNLAASAVIHAAYFLLTAHAYRNGELSLVYPLARGTAPLLSSICAALLLEEFPSAVGWTGILLIVCGVIVQAADARHQQNASKAVTLALMNACVIALYTLVDGTGIRLSGNPFSYICWMFFLTGMTLIILVSIRNKSIPWQYCRNNWRHGLMGGICTFGSYGLALWAMIGSSIALVAALRETSVVFVLLIAALVLKERITFVRCFSAFAVTTGALAIRFA